MWVATHLLMGLRYSDELVVSLFKEVKTMHQSTTYERILREGRLGEAHRFIRRLGTEKFGAPGPTAASDLEAIQDVDHLEALGVRILRPDVKSWDDLLEGE